MSDALYLYLSISGVVVSSVLVKDEDNTHVPVYFVSNVLTLLKMKYVEIEKYLYALIILASKLSPYFYAHSITVLTNHPLKHFSQKPGALGRIVKWEVKLSEFPITFAPRTTIKRQTLSDFIVESTGPPIQDVMPMTKAMNEE